METIDFCELTDIEPLFKENPKFTSFATIMKTKYNGKTYAMKYFNDKILMTKKFRCKYECLSDIDEKSLKVPKIMVLKKGVPFTYLAEFEQAKNISKLAKEKKNTQIKVLKSAKENLLTAHNYGIIHADIHGGNILFNDKGTYYIDFDNSTYKDYKTIPSLTTIFAQDFIKKYGLVKELDIAMFNLLTFYLINNGIYFLTRRDIIKENYGKFYDADSIRICKNLLLEDKNPTTDFLIDSLKL